MKNLNSLDQFKIRDIEEKDIKNVYRMLTSLVTYEKLEERFKLSEEKMAGCFFGKCKNWFCLVAEDLSDNCLKGFLAYTLSHINRAFHLSPLFYIDHLYVEPKYRQFGLGESFIKALKDRARAQGTLRIEVWCMKTNMIGNKFYEKVGAEPINIVNMYRINSE